MILIICFCVLNWSHVLIHDLFQPKDLCVYASVCKRETERIRESVCVWILNVKLNVGLPMCKLNVYDYRK